MNKGTVLKFPVKSFNEEHKNSLNNNNMKDNIIYINKNDYRINYIGNNNNNNMNSINSNNIIKNISFKKKEIPHTIKKKEEKKNGG